MLQVSVASRRTSFQMKLHGCQLSFNTDTDYIQPNKTSCSSIQEYAKPLIALLSTSLDTHANENSRNLRTICTKQSMVVKLYKRIPFPLGLCGVRKSSSVFYKMDSTGFACLKHTVF